MLAQTDNMPAPVNSSPVAPSVLVSLTDQLLSRPIQLPLRRDLLIHPSSREREGPMADHQDTPIDWLDNFRRSYTEAGLSRKAADLASKARRDSMRQSYNSRLRRFYKWCRCTSINPNAASLGEIGTFLTEVFKDVEPRVPRAYRTVNAAVHKVPSHANI
jgi:hypothetical protein